VSTNHAWQLDTSIGHANRGDLGLLASFSLLAGVPCDWLPS
jgi:hypothetical protein